jgi:nucleoside 2-deoxyribosyltransferase
MSDTDTPRFFLAMPFSEEFKYLNQLITSSLEEVGIKPILWEEAIKHGEPIANTLQKAIELADFVIVDVTGNDPNVLFEAGFASGLGKPIIPIVQRTAGRVPFDISGRLYLVYDPSEPAKLRNNIKAWALSYLESRGEVSEQ